MTTPEAVPFLFSSPSALTGFAWPWRRTCLYKGQSRVHAESDLRARAYLIWCLERGADPRQVSRPQVKLYVRWMQEIRRFKPHRQPPPVGDD